MTVYRLRPWGMVTESMVGFCAMGVASDLSTT
jgi:hypothetical protein